MIQLTENIFAVEVPGDAFSLRIDLNGSRRKLSALLSETTPNGHWNKTWEWYLPEGEWQHLCTSFEITEEQAKEIVPIEWGGFAGNVKGYMVYFKPDEWSMDHEPYKTALESFHSLLRSKSLGRVEIIKKV